jgi:DNA-binding transcriptional regulator YiaG
VGCIPPGVVTLAQRVASWHTVAMTQGPRSYRRHHQLECAVSKDGALLARLPASLRLRMSRRAMPSSDETRWRLVAIRRLLAWSYADLAVYMGVSDRTVRSWERGTRKPTGMAARLIWSLEKGLFPETEVGLDCFREWRRLPVEELLQRANIRGKAEPS